MTPTRILIALALALFALPCLEAFAEDSAAPSRKKLKLEYLYMTVTGAKADRVAAAAKRRVEAVTGVHSFAWTTAHSEAKIVRVVGRASTATLVAAFKEAGVSAAAMDIGQIYLVFAKKRPDCEGCTNKVRVAVMAVKGTKEVLVKPKDAGVTVVYDKKKATPEKIKRALAGTRYPVKP